MSMPWEKGDAAVRSIEILKWLIEEHQDAVSYYDLLRIFYPHAPVDRPKDDDSQQTKELRRRCNRDAAERLRKLATWGMIERIPWDSDLAGEARKRLEKIMILAGKPRLGRRPAVYIVTGKGKAYLKERLERGEEAAR